MTNASVLNWNTIELHYWFNDESHTMNAIVLNKCEYEFLGIAKEIAQTLKGSNSKQKIRMRLK